jgi:predicted Zn-dependent protease
LALAHGTLRVFPQSRHGKLQLDLLSESQEIEMGQQARQEVAQTTGLYHDPRLEAYIADLGKPLAANSGRPQLPFSYQIVEDASVNAFALPGGPTTAAPTPSTDTRRRAS